MLILVTVYEKGNATAMAAIATAAFWTIKIEIKSNELNNITSEAAAAAVAATVRKKKNEMPSVECRVCGAH